MGEERLVPKLRFNGFDDNWKEVKIKDISKSITKGTTPKKYSDDGINFIKVESIINNKITKIDAYIDEDTHNNELNRSILKKNDLLFSIAGSLGRTTIITDDVLPANTNQALSIIRFEENTDLNLNFIQSRLNTYDIAKYIFQNLAVGAQPNLNLQQVGNININIPSHAEQEKIQKFFDYIDKKIELLENKYKNYKNFKKYLMQQIFAQKLRFADFTDDWKITKLGEITQINTGNKDVKDKIDDGKYPFFVRSEKVERINSYSYEGEAILIPGDGKIGEVYHYINGKFDYHQRVYKISDFKSHVNGKYIYYYLEKNFLKQALRNTAKATVDSLRMDTLTKMPIELPSLEEQIKIADALSIADDKIDLVEKDIKIIKDFKKGLLQQMFVYMQTILNFCAKICCIKYFLKS